MFDDEYVRRCEVTRILDGDSFEVRIDYGFRQSGRFLVRLRGIDCAELPTPEGVRAKNAAERLFRDAKVITMKSYKDQMSFARWVADMWVDGVPMIDLLNQILVRPE